MWLPLIPDWYIAGTSYMANFSPLQHFNIPFSGLAGVIHCNKEQRTLKTEIILTKAYFSLILVSCVRMLQSSTSKSRTRVMYRSPKIPLKPTMLQLWKAMSCGIGAVSSRLDVSLDTYKADRRATSVSTLVHAAKTRWSTGKGEVYSVFTDCAKKIVEQDRRRENNVWASYNER